MTDSTYSGRLRYDMTIPDHIQKVLLYVVMRVYCSNWTMDEIMRGVENEDHQNYIMFKQMYPEAVEYIERQLNGLVEWMSA